jgi:tRNA A-37 threonylcarbamoyl transferase component Bud32
MGPEQALDEHESNLLSVLQESIRNGSLVVVDNSIDFDPNEVRSFDPALDLGVIVIDDSSRHDPRMIVVGDEVLFLKEIPNHCIDLELQAHEKCQRAGLNHFAPVAYAKGEGNYGMIATRREFIVPLSKVEINDILTYRSLVENICELLNKLHIAGVLHRDAKPKNMGYSDQGYWIYDFETSQIYDHPVSFDEHIKEIYDFLTYVTSYVLTDAKLAARKSESHWAQDPRKALLVQNLGDELLSKYRAYPYR